MKKSIQSVGTGLGIGFTTYMVFMVIYQQQQTANQIVSVWLMSALIGVVSLVFRVEKLSLLTKTFIQYIATAVLFFSTAYYNNWFSIQNKDSSIAISILIAIAIFTVVFLIIWIVIYFYQKSNIEKINRFIQAKNAK